MTTMPKASLALRAYLAASHLIPLVAGPVLARRRKRGKEHPTRWVDKQGRGLAARPAGRLVWINAVGLGEILSLRGLIARMVAAQTAAPPSLRSSRATEVITACFKFILAIDSATRAGSPRSSSVGRPVLIAQKVHERVQMLPRIMTVAVPRDQHSPMFGRCALLQTVCRSFVSTISRTALYSTLVGSFARSHSGLRLFIRGGSVPKNVLKFNC